MSEFTWSLQSRNVWLSTYILRCGSCISSGEMLSSTTGIRYFFLLLTTCSSAMWNSVKNHPASTEFLQKRMGQWPFGTFLELHFQTTMLFRFCALNSQKLTDTGVHPSDIIIFLLLKVKGSSSCNIISLPTLIWSWPSFYCGLMQPQYWLRLILQPGNLSHESTLCSQVLPQGIVGYASRADGPNDCR